MCILKRIVSVFLIGTLVFVGLPFNNIKTKAIDIQKVYNSDLFNAYPEHLNDSVYLNNYVQEHMGIYNDIYYDYVESPRFKWTGVKEGLSNVLNLTEWLKLINDGIIAGSDGDYTKTFTYTDALDEGNKILAKHLIGMGGDFADVLGTGSEWTEMVSKLAELSEKLKLWQKTGSFDDIEVLEQAFTLLGESGLLKKIGTGTLETIKGMIIPDAESASEIISVCGNVLKAGQALMTSLLMEEIRLTAIETILRSGPEGTLSDGINRLNDQLSGGFITYFIDSYIKNELIAMVSDEIVEKLAGAAIGSAGVFVVLSLILEIGTFVTFDLIFPTNDIDEVTSQYVLTDYIYGVKTLIDKKKDTFCKQFSLKDVMDYQNLYSILRACVNAAGEASEAIASSELSVTLRAVTNKYKGHDIFEKTINDLNSLIEDLPVTERKRIFYDEWKIDAKCAFSDAANKLAEDTIYLTNGEFNGNILLSLDGSSSSNVNYLKIAENQQVVVNGSVLDDYDSHWGGIENNGVFTVKGDFNPRYYTSSEETARLNVGGNLASHNFNISGKNSITTVTGNIGGNINVYGTLLLNGTTQQTLSGVVAENIIVENKAGIKYDSDINISNKFLLNGNPLECGNYYTVFGGEKMITDDISDYKKVKVINCSFEGTVKADICLGGFGWNDSNVEYFKIPEGANAKIIGNVYDDYDAHWGGIENNGNLTVTGNFEPDYYSSVKNAVNLTVGGSLKSHHFNMTEEESTVTVGGDVFGFEYYELTIPGTTVLNGTQTQEVQYFNTKNLIVENKEGIKYNSDINVSNKFLLNGNPLECGNYYTVFGGEKMITDDISDYKKVKVKGCSFEGTIKADVFLGGFGWNDSNVEYFKIPEGANAKIIGNVYDDYDAHWGGIENNGNLTVTGNFEPDYYSSVKNAVNLTVGGNLSANRFNMTDDESVVTVGGNINGDIYRVIAVPGTTVLNGTQTQEVQYFNTKNLIVENEVGIKYNSDINVSNKFLLSGNPLDCGNYYTVFDGEKMIVDEVSDYKKVKVKGCSFEGTIKADVFLGGFGGGSSSVEYFTIPEGANAKIIGSVSDDYNAYWGGMKNNGNLTVTGSFYAEYYNSTAKDARLNVASDLNSTYFSMSGENSIITVGGNINSNITTSGAVIFNGTEKQEVTYITAPTMIIENTSSEGVCFMWYISPTNLFNHKGNAFSLYQNGEYSTFNDYDKDGLLDNVDSDPVVFDYDYYYTKRADITGDGQTNIMDLVRFKKNFIGEKDLIDIDEDGNISSYDLVVMRKILLKKFDFMGA